VDVFANDLGFIAIVGNDGELQGFNVTIGGGMGVTHGNKKTYPRIGSLIGFCTPEQGKYVAEKVMLVQRDHGNRVEWVSFLHSRNPYIDFFSVAVRWFGSVYPSSKSD
jgi:sulfite reductase (NADPH) hemoprotein beta-component